MDAAEWLGLQPTHNPHRWFLPVTEGIATGGRFLFGGDSPGKIAQQPVVIGQHGMRPAKCVGGGPAGLEPQLRYADRSMGIAGREDGGAFERCQRLLMPLHRVQHGSQQPVRTAR